MYRLTIFQCFRSSSRSIRGICCGDFLIPGGAQIGCCSFDRTGTTRLGTWVLNHSYMRAGLVHVITGVATGCLIYSVI